MQRRGIRKEGRNYVRFGIGVVMSKRIEEDVDDGIGTRMKSLGHKQRRTDKGEEDPIIWTPDLPIMPD